MRLHRFRPLAIACIPLQLAACMRWQPADLAPRPLIEEERPSKVLVIRTDGSEVEVPSPVVRQDSIVTSEPCERVITPDGRADCAVPPVAVALTDVRLVEVQRMDVLATGGAVLLAPVVLVGFVLLACSVDDSCLGS